MNSAKYTGDFFTALDDQNSTNEWKLPEFKNSTHLQKFNTSTGNSIGKQINFQSRLFLWRKVIYILLKDWEIKLKVSKEWLNYKFRSPY